MGWIPDKGSNSFRGTELERAGEPVDYCDSGVEACGGGNIERCWGLGQRCQVLRSWDFILRKRSAFEQYLRVLNTLPC